MFLTPVKHMDSFQSKRWDGNIALSQAIKCVKSVKSIKLAGSSWNHGLHPMDWEKAFSKQKMSSGTLNIRKTLMCWIVVTNGTLQWHLATVVGNEWLHFRQFCCSNVARLQILKSDLHWLWINSMPWWLIGEGYLLELAFLHQNSLERSKPREAWREVNQLGEK